MSDKSSDFPMPKDAIKISSDAFAAGEKAAGRSLTIQPDPQAEMSIKPRSFRSIAPGDRDDFVMTPEEYAAIQAVISEGKHLRKASEEWASDNAALRARVAELEGELAAAKTDKALLEVSNGSLRSMVDAPLPKSEFERIVTAPSDADRKALVEVMRSLGMVSAYTRGVDCIGPKDAAAIFEAIADRARAAGT
jgi:hypothetical protein